VLAADFGDATVEDVAGAAGKSLRKGELSPFGGTPNSGVSSEQKADDAAGEQRLRVAAGAVPPTAPDKLFHSAEAVQQQQQQQQQQPAAPDKLFHAAVGGHDIVGRLGMESNEDEEEEDLIAWSQGLCVEDLDGSSDAVLAALAEML
ncbi:unnamed protein product, partial [Polarella glacialis]